MPIPRITTFITFLCVGVALAACASIVEGTDQTVNMQVSPDTAVCKLSQKGSVIATIDKGGGQVQVPKSRDDISVDCDAPGYDRQTVNIESSASGWGVVGCFLIDLCITDYSTGALNKYPKSITIKLRQTALAAANNGSAAMAPPFPPNSNALPQSAAGQQAGPATGAPSLPMWHTIADNVQAYTTHGWVPMPMLVALVLIEQRGDMGLFQYSHANGASAQGWIAMANVRQEV